MVRRSAAAALRRSDVGLRARLAATHARSPTLAATMPRALRGMASPLLDTPAAPGRQARTRNASACVKARLLQALLARAFAQCAYARFALPLP